MRVLPLAPDRSFGAASSDLTSLGRWARASTLSTCGRAARLCRIGLSG